MRFKSTALLLAQSKWRWYFTGAMLLFLTACEDPEENPGKVEYFPVTTGAYRVYAVEEAIYSSGVKEPKSGKWFEKEEVMSIKKDSNGVSECIIAYSVRAKSTDYWQKTKEYKAFIYPEKVVVNRDNEAITSLVFPYSPTVQWDGYQHFSLDDDDPRWGFQFHYEDLDKPLQVDSLHFPATLKVTERIDTTGPVLYRFGYKTYAKGIGLVLDVRTDYDYLQNNGDLVGYRIIDKGVRRVRKIIEYGDR
ncbi:hypothetical protein SAMN04487996_107252 [Dyadobacter soli]|uniref:Uncharacterized protein n=1 Tax=Dyadobacter soli TaxID=659014 RepID=A0A1G7GH11_9BACT|nr:hypothetical protein [Dyadobacter soli]SDE87420.1 hypothetical protein SAMN04487996_107252 [Dyadobacter soli]